tara:strand:- start:104 stop:283 length:180 start_codon:yes stop_codon:yes gene_type:complete
VGEHQPAEERRESLLHNFAFTIIIFFIIIIIITGTMSKLDRWPKDGSIMVGTYESVWKS